MPISRKRNELSVGVLTAVFLSIQFLLPLKVPGTFLWALLPTLIRINTAVLYSALLLCSTQLSDVKMNTYSNRCDAKPTAAHTGRCLAVLPCCLFLKIRKSKPSFAQVLESHIAGVKVLFWHVQRFLLTESARRRQKKTEQGWWCEKEWNMCKRQEEKARAECSAFLRISQRGDMRENQSWKGRDGRIYKRYRNYVANRKQKTEGKRDRGIESCVTQNKRSWERVWAVKKTKKQKIPPARSPSEQPSWVANYDELLGALVGVGASPVSI